MKEKLRQEEEQQSKYMSQKQEEMFRKAREEMERELQNNSFNSKQGNFKGYTRFDSYSQEQTQAYDSNRLAAIEHEINKIAIEQMKAYLKSSSFDS